MQFDTRVSHQEYTMLRVIVFIIIYNFWIFLYFYFFQFIGHKDIIILFFKANPFFIFLFRVICIIFNIL